MNVRTLCLAILVHGDATGYEIRKHSVEGNFSYFVDASYGAIYPALNRLTEEGLVTVREEMQAGKPARRVYSITPAGRRAFLEALSEAPGPDHFKSPFLLVAMFAEMLPRQHLKKAVDERVAGLRETLQTLTDCLGNLEAREGGSEWILRYGMAMHEASLAYMQEHRDELLEIAGTADAASEAAE